MHIHIYVYNILQAAKPVTEVPAAQPAAILNVIIVFLKLLYEKQKMFYYYYYNYDENYHYDYY